MSDSHAPHRSLFAVWHWPRWAWAVAVVLVVIGYPLSFGPAVYLAENGYLPLFLRRTLVIVYRPLVLLSTQWHSFRRALMSYCQWWLEP